MVVNLYSKARELALIFPLLSSVTEHLFMSLLITKGNFNNRESMAEAATWAPVPFQLPACSFTCQSSCIICRETLWFCRGFFFLIGNWVSRISKVYWREGNSRMFFSISLAIVTYPLQNLKVPVVNVLDKVFFSLFGGINNRFSEGNILSYTWNSWNLVSCE